ncbi:MAG: hypothetical protein AB7Y46_12595 [Armatimonadota bacterium]
MCTTTKLLTVAALACVAVGGAWAADYAGPKLEGTATLRSGATVSGVILTAQLGIVDGAEIGSRLRDGGYIAVNVDGEERHIAATEIAAIEAEWAQTGTEDNPKWKITRLTVTTTGGETVTGQPAWLVHATSLVIEEPDGTQRKIYAFPMAGSNFSPDNLMSRLTIGAPQATPAEATPSAAEAVPAPAEAAPAPAEAAPAPAEAASAPAEAAPAPAEAAPAPAEAAPAPAEAAPAPAETGEAVAAPEAVATITMAPVIEAVPEGAVFATGQPAVVTFEVINPETGNPMKVRFLIVPLPAE